MNLSVRKAPFNLTVITAMVFTMAFIGLTYHIRGRLFELNGIFEMPTAFQDELDYLSLGNPISFLMPAILCFLHFSLLFFIARYFNRRNLELLIISLCWVALWGNLAWIAYTLAYVGIELPIIKSWPLATALVSVTSLITLYFALILNRYNEKIQLLKRVSDSVSVPEETQQNTSKESILEITPEVEALISRDKLFITRFEIVLKEGLTDAEFTVDKMAQELALERSTLFRKTQQHFNASPSELISNARMDWAKQLLQHDGRSITDIALTIGYNSSAHFSYSFKKKFHLSPSEYRKRYKKTDLA